MLSDVQSPPLLLLILLFPGMTGEPLIAHIHKSCNVPIIVLSSNEARQDKVACLRLVGG